MNTYKCVTGMIGFNGPLPFKIFVVIAVLTFSPEDLRSASQDQSSRSLYQRPTNQDPSRGPVASNTPGLSNPRVIKQTVPSYTDAAIAAKVEGHILLKCIIRGDGRVDSFKVLRGLGYGLEESAIREISTNWRFQPGTMDGKPIDVLATIEVQFNLRGSKVDQSASDNNRRTDGLEEAQANRTELDELLRSGVQATASDLHGKWYCVGPNPYDPGSMLPHEVEYYPGGTVEAMFQNKSIVGDYSFIAPGKVRFDWRAGTNLSSISRALISSGKLVWVGAETKEYSICSRNKPNLPSPKTDQELLLEINSYCSRLQNLSDQRRIAYWDMWNYCQQYNFFMGGLMKGAELRAHANRARKAFEAVLRKNGLDPSRVP